MSLDHNPQCSACKIANSLMWRKGSSGEVLCNSCHLKRVNSSIRTQRQSSKESKKLIARIKAGTRKGYNGKSGERSRGRRTLQKIKRKVSWRVVVLPEFVSFFSCAEDWKLTVEHSPFSNPANYQTERLIKISSYRYMRVDQNRLIYIHLIGKMLSCKKHNYTMNDTTQWLSGKRKNLLLLSDTLEIILTRDTSIYSKSS